MKEKLFSEKELTNPKKSFKKPLILIISTIFLISVYFYITISSNSNKPSLSFKSLAKKKSQPNANKVKIIQYVSPNKV